MLTLLFASQLGQVDGSVANAGLARTAFEAWSPTSVVLATAVSREHLHRSPSTTADWSSPLEIMNAAHPCGWLLPTRPKPRD